jgi:Ni2+-binding GTPase involved in maturation of urease and hydrogenase
LQAWRRQQEAHPVGQPPAPRLAHPGPLRLSILGPPGTGKTHLVRAISAALPLGVIKKSGAHMSVARRIVGVPGCALCTHPRRAYVS